MPGTGAPRSEELHVFLTMDCERVADRDLSVYNMGAPPDWGFSENAIRCFDRILAEERLIGTFFVVPEAAAAHRGLLLEMSERGHELGMHLHPQGLGDFRWKRFLGEYDPAVQLDLLGRAAEAWSAALGRRPSVFRPGNFSGDPSLFATLIEAGFSGGSVSLPGRSSGTMAARWGGFGCRCRLLARSFLEVPVSSIQDRIDTGSSFRDPPHLRIESASMGAGPVRAVVEHVLASGSDEGVLPRTLVAMTHNTCDYGDPVYSARLRVVLRTIRDCAAERGLRLRNGTIESLRAAVLADADGTQRAQA